jgi:GNAT superfamily N-acetyltransferase
MSEKVEEKLEFTMSLADLEDSKVWCFLTSSIWQSLGQSTNYFGMPRQAFIHLINESLSNAKQYGMQCLLATDPEDKDLFLGYALSKDAGIVFVYTKAAFRGQGIATALVKELFPGANKLYCPKATPVAVKLAKHRGVTLVETDFWCTKV